MTDSAALSQEEFRRLCEYLYPRTGMVFNETKRYYVERRVIERMSATAAQSFASYFAHLRTDKCNEVEQFVNAFTVNETYFYREEHQLHCLTADLLRERVAGEHARNTIRIWSVPCSTGEEPYSIAMWLLEQWPQVDDYEIEILGSDIDTQALQQARAGVYGRRALMRLTPQLIGKYFTALPDDRWQIDRQLRDSITYSVVNLVDANETRRHGRFDVIFCRNVLIYFDDAARRLAAENLYESLLPGGFLCLGHTESMSRISPLFEARRFADTIVYQRPVAWPA